ncbi:MAG TPA: GNAT family N-acetyltransferase [Gammaproteobacteria bacterium]|nr:GNAT family N-acetyltransferase [Gammaproteobacteria bacterium]
MEPPESSARIRVRPARPADLDALVRLEETCFRGDRLSRRSLRHALTRGAGAFLVAVMAGALVGYAMVSVHSNRTAARLYSIAVAPRARGRGVGRRLLAAAERAARGRGCDRLRLEARIDNRAAMRLYRSRGYLPFARWSRYYEDGCDALRFEKRLRPMQP